MSTQIIITDAALTYLKSKLNDSYFRLSIKKTGCSGLSYLPQIVKEVSDQDVEVRLDPNFTIFLDRQWLPLLRELTIDYVEEQTSGLKQKRLVFKNPQEKNRCGCGESFHIEDHHE